MAAPLMLCAYCHHAQGLNTRAQKLDSCAEPSAARTYPTGCCIQASVAMIKKPDIHDPRKTATADHQWARGLSLFSPYRNNPRNADSRKNANMPSIARVCPITPPAKRENTAQFVPNWNSIGIPVTTPSTKLMPKIRAQKRAAW